MAAAARASGADAATSEVDDSPDTRAEPMATIAKYVADMEVDPTGVKAGLDRAAAYLRQFSATANNTLKPRSGAGFLTIEQGIEAETQSALAQLNQLPPAHEHAAHAAEGHHLTINRLERGLEAFAVRATGTNEVLGLMGAAFLNFGAGGLWTVAILTGLAAIVFAWEKATEKTREAKKAMEEFGKADEAFAARSRAQATTAATFSTIAGGFGHFIDVEGITHGIDAAEKAVKGFQNELLRTSNIFTGKTAVTTAIESLRSQFVAGKIDANRLNIELAKIAATRPEYSRYIEQTAVLAAGLDAARESVIRLTAAEQHRAALAAETEGLGAVGGLAKSLAEAQARLQALQRGGEPALKAIQREQTATETATKAWDEYVVTKEGARDATLTFTAALAAHNPVADRAYRLALQLAEANDKVADGLKVKNPVELIDHMASSLLAWHEAAKKAGTLTSIFSPKIADAMVEVGKLFDKETDKLSDNAIRLQAILAKLTEAFLDFGALGSPQITGPARPNGINAPAVTSLLRGGTASTVGLEGLRGGPGFTLPAPRSPQVGQTESLNTARLNAAFELLTNGAKSAASGLLSIVRSGFVSLIQNVVSQLSPFALIAKSLTDAMAPLTPVLTQIARVVGDALTPIFTALAPIIQSFIPFFRALLQIIAPLVRALLPILQAIVPILEALFPIIKFVAIAFTYVVQAAALVGSILLRMAGNVVIVFGTILKAFAEGIDSLPFVSAKHAIEAAQGVIDFGKGLLNTADEFKKTADAMAGAREEIKGVNIDHTAVAIDTLGDAATKTAAALTNVPSWFKIALVRYNAAAVATGNPLDLHPLDVHPYRPINPPKLSKSTGAGAAGGGATGAGGLTINGDVNVDARSRSASDMFDEILDEGRKRARAQFGDANRWSEVQQ